MTFENIKALIAVLVFAIPAFYICGRIASPAIAPREFAVLRNAWFAATIAAFLFSNFFVFAAVLAIICIWARSQGASAPALFFVILLAVPLASVEIGGLDVVNRLLPLNHARVLAIVVLLPVLLAPSGFSRREVAGHAMPDRLLLGYVLLIVVLAYRESSMTHILRVTVVHSLDILIPYFALSRCVTSLADLRKVLMAFVVAVIPLCPIAVFELAKGWRIYGGMMDAWGMVLIYSMRGGLLRASASAADPIVFGFIIMVAIGCMLALRKVIASPQLKILAVGILVAGLAVTLSRGPWVGTAILVMAWFASGRGTLANFGKISIAATAVALLVALVMPDAVRLADLLPFTTMDVSTIEYRQRLLENALDAIAREPWFGSEDFRLMPEFKELDQGGGFVDFVNHHLTILLDSGLVGWGLFLGFFCGIVLSLLRVHRFVAPRDSDLGLCARAAAATLIAILITLGTVSAVGLIPNIFWSFAGVCVAVVRVAYRERSVRAGSAVAHGLS